MAEQRSRGQKLAATLAVMALGVLAAVGLSLNTDNQLMVAGPTFPLTESIRVPEPFNLDDTEGEWVALTVGAAPISTAHQLWLELVGKKDEILYAAGADPDAAPRAEAETARQVALNLGFESVYGHDGMLEVQSSTFESTPAGTRILAIEGHESLTPGTQEPGAWLVVTPKGRYAVAEVPDGAVVEAEWVETRAHESSTEPLPAGPDAPSEDPFGLTKVGGSSAGLVQTLAWVDILTEGDFTDGRSIAATGSVNDAGEVLPVAGVKLKLEAAVDAGVDLVLVPDEYDGPIPEGLRVEHVATVEDAIQVVQGLPASAR